jgi:NAD(P)H-hydrate epimerase
MKKAISESDVGLVGCGLGKHPDLVKLVEKIILTSKIPLVLDGDGLNAISKDVDILKEADCPIIITPHPGEMSRLIDKPIDQIQDNRTEVAKRFASDYNVTVVLKGHRTIVAKNNKEYYINKTGNPGMATAGSGDVLAGMIASFLGQKIGIYGSCKLGVYLHGLSGDIAASKKGQISLIASDILENISEAFNKM